VASADAAVVAEMSDRLAAGSGFSVDVRHLALFGVCAGCQDAGS
jgi:Fe2+ or Zn2+ uptake regulation protein